MKWFSWSAVVLLLIMAVTIDATILFLPVSMLTYFITGERYPVPAVVDDLHRADRFRVGFDRFACSPCLYQA